LRAVDGFIALIFPDDTSRGNAIARPFDVALSFCFNGILFSALDLASPPLPDDCSL
jgi:hypothetical protein